MIDSRHMHDALSGDILDQNNQLDVLSLHHLLS